MRPQIPENLEEQIEEVYKKAGYTTETEFIRGAIRHHIEDARVQSQPLFNPNQLYNNGNFRLGTNPENNSEVYTDIFERPLGNMFILGYIGTGKSYLSRKIGERALKEVENLHIVEIDVLSESKYGSDGNKERQDVAINTNSNISLLEPVTGKPELDSKIVTESIQSQSDMEVPLSFRQMVQFGFESDVGVQEYIGNQLPDEDGGFRENVLNALDFIRPYTTGEHADQCKTTEFDITDKPITTLKPEANIIVPTVVEAYRQAMRTDDPVLIMFDEAHVILGEGYGWFLDLYDGHDSIGTILVSQEDNPTHDSYIDAVFNRTDDFLALRSNISTETAARLELNSKQAEKLEGLYTYKNDNHESEIMYRKRNQDWILMNPTIGD